MLVILRQTDRVVTICLSFSSKVTAIFKMVSLYTLPDLNQHNLVVGCHEQYKTSLLQSSIALPENVVSSV